MQETNYAVASTSMSHTFGNVTAFITEYVKGLFPVNYFKTVNIASMISYRNFNIFDNTNREFIKKNKPMLIIRPRVDVMNNDVFMNGSLMTTRITDNFYDRDFGNLLRFIDDGQKGLEVRFLMNRMKMYFDITIITESQMEQLNQAIYLKNRVRQELPFIIETALESNVPRPIMEAIADDAGLDITKTKEFLDYVNSKSMYPVTYKLKNSTGRDEFFRYYPAEIDAIITGLTADDGSKKGFVDDSYAVNFTIETEFTTAGLYYYFTKSPESTQKIAMSLDASLGANGSIAPMFTVINLYNEEPPIGWNLYTSPMYKVDYSNRPDVLPFGELLNNSIESAVKFHLEKGILIDTFLKIVIMKDNEKLSKENGDYSIDYETLTLTTNKVNTTSTYRMVVYVNTLYINTLLGDLLDIHTEK